MPATIEISLIHATMGVALMHATIGLPPVMPATIGVYTSHACYDRGTIKLIASDVLS